MGNYVSCSLSTPLIKSFKAARVILPGGEVRQFRQPVKAAELMLECPNFFLANSQSLNIGKRFSALAADEEVEFGNVYVMFPMKRLNSIVTAADMAILFIVAKRISAGRHSKIRILPETASGAGDVNNVEESCGGGEVRASRLLMSSDDKEEEILGFPVAEYKYRLSACRSRKPALETIKEEPLHSR